MIVFVLPPAIVSDLAASVRLLGARAQPRLALAGRRRGAGQLEADLALLQPQRLALEGHGRLGDGPASSGGSAAAGRAAPAGRAGRRPVVVHEHGVVDVVVLRLALLPGLHLRIEHLHRHGAELAERVRAGRGDREVAGAHGAHRDDVVVAGGPVLRGRRGHLQWRVERQLVNSVGRRLKGRALAAGAGAAHGVRDLARDRVRLEDALDDGDAQRSRVRPGANPHPRHEARARDEVRVIDGRARLVGGAGRQAGRLTLIFERRGEPGLPARLAPERLAAGRRREGHRRALVVLRLSLGGSREERNGREDDDGRARERADEEDHARRYPENGAPATGSARMLTDSRPRRGSGTRGRAAPSARAQTGSTSRRDAGRVRAARGSRR